MSMQDIVLGLMEMNPANRMSIIDALAHPWTKGTNPVERDSGGISTLGFDSSLPTEGYFFCLSLYLEISVLLRFFLFKKKNNI